MTQWKTKTNSIRAMNQATTKRMMLMFKCSMTKQMSKTMSFEQKALN